MMLLYATVCLLTAIWQHGVYCNTSPDEAWRESMEARLVSLTNENEELRSRITALEQAANTSNTSSASNTVAFSAWRNSIAAVLANGIIIYDIVEANLGDAYNPPTGIFTCPVTGYYVFSVFAMSLASGDEWTNVAAINVGGTLKAAAFADQAYWDQGAMTVVTRCDTGTQVFVQNKSAGAAYYNSKYVNVVVNSFIGYLISIVA